MSDDIPGPTESIPISPDRLDFARRAAGLTQSELARRAGLSPSHISRILNGDTRVTIDALAWILDVFGNRLSVRDLVDVPDPDTDWAQTTRIRGGRAT